MSTESHDDVVILNDNHSNNTQQENDNLKSRVETLALRTIQTLCVNQKLMLTLFSSANPSDLSNIDDNWIRHIIAYESGENKETAAFLLRSDNGMETAQIEWLLQPEEATAATSSTASQHHSLVISAKSMSTGLQVLTQRIQQAATEQLRQMLDGSRREFTVLQAHFNQVLQARYLQPLASIIENQDAIATQFTANAMTLETELPRLLTEIQQNLPDDTHPLDAPYLPDRSLPISIQQHPWKSEQTTSSSIDSPSNIDNAGIGSLLYHSVETVKRRTLQLLTSLATPQRTSTELQHDCLSREIIVYHSNEAGGTDYFLRWPTVGDGDCGFRVLGIKREQFCETLLDAREQEEIRELLGRATYSEKSFIRLVYASFNDNILSISKWLSLAA